MCPAPSTAASPRGSTADGLVAEDPVVLIVDDNPKNLFALEQVLRGLPARVLRAFSGDEALALALRHSFAVAILDVQMPGMDGFELAELLLGNPSTSRLPIIFVSAAFQDELHRWQGYQSGAVDYLLKPVEPKILLGKVRVFLELARARAELERVVGERTRKLEAKARQLQRRNAMRSLLAEVSRTLSHFEPMEAWCRVERATAQVAVELGASHAFLHAPPDGPLGEMDLSWFAEPLLHQAGGLPRSSFLPALASLWSGGAGEGRAFASLDELPVAPEDREELRQVGVRSLLLLPIREAEATVGVLGFDWRGAHAPEPPELLDLTESLSLLPDLLHGAQLWAASEARRVESQELHRTLFETIAHGVVYQDAQGAILSANAAADRILGLSSTEMVGRDAADARWQPLRADGSLLPPDEYPAHVALRTGRPVQGVVMGVFSPRYGDHRWILADAVPLTRPGESTPFRVHTTFSDITDLRRATAEKERLLGIEAESRAKSQFLASMSHEIRTPMNAMLGYTQLLLREPSLPAQQREYLETIDRSGAHLLTLVNNVLDMARIEAGVEPLAPAPTDLASLLADVARMFRLRAIDKRLELQVERAPSLPGRLLVDAVKVRQVLINLLGNALKFTQRGGVTVRASASSPQLGSVSVRIEVEDTGVGIAPGQLEAVFDPFVQAAPGASGGGTGLGLSVSRRFARLMGGDVSARSTPGQGSTFRFTFEAQCTEEAPAGGDDRRVVGLAPGSPHVRVLLVEDDADNRQVLSRLLAAVGFEVREAATVEAGLSSFVGAPVELVLTDMRLPDGDGLALLRRLRALPGGAEVPVVVVSASTLQDQQAQAVAAGVDGFVGKPVREGMLFDEIARLTGVRYLLAGEEAPPADPLTPEALLHLPAGRRQALLEALQGGYVDQVAAEVERACQASPPALAAALRETAGRFDYAWLISALEPGRAAP